MRLAITIQQVESQLLAAVHRRVLAGGVGAVWKPALDQVWAFLRERPELRDGGHNLFLYGHPRGPREPMEVEFGVQVIGDFAPHGEVRPVETPSGEAAVGLHVGPYSRLHETHAAIQAWMEANGRRSAGWSWEIYGDWSDDSTRLETTVVYLLS
ncbi:MAG: hypothetical protein JWM33_3655 [Caulobacteraceae bacterium]|nr:hypothetical protein [Caulobacteraceae bacterium]